jgi:hypothetical protein
MTIGRKIRVVGNCAVVFLVTALSVHTANGEAVDQFGIRSRTNAARQMIVLAVQQGISSLPPTSGQAFVWEYSPEIANYTPSERLGPTSFRAADTIGDGKLSVRMTGSYFDINDSLGPVPYEIFNLNGQSVGYTRFGLDASAQVGLVNLGVTYGIGNRFELMFNLPIVVVDAQVANRYLTRVSLANAPPGQAGIYGARTNAEIDGLLQCNDRDCLRYRTESVDVSSKALQAKGFRPLDFSNGTKAGVGRISLGGKGVLYRDERFHIAAMAELFVPSPSEDELAGSETGSFLPRLIGSAKITETVKLHADAGYDADFETSELRRFVWNVGSSVALASVTFDFGFGGSKFNEGIEFTPREADFGDSQGNPVGTIKAAGDRQLGSNFVDFLAGIKVSLTKSVVLSGAVNVPINNEGFRPTAVGTVGLEFYL